MSEIKLVLNLSYSWATRYFSNLSNKDYVLETLMDQVSNGNLCDVATVNRKDLVASLSNDPREDS